MLKNKILTAILCFFTVILIITFSIGLPIYFRPFYYIQIDSLGVVEATGYDKKTVKAAYDEILDYLTVPGKEFGTGVFSYSESGKRFSNQPVLSDATTHLSAVQQRFHSLP